MVKNLPLYNILYLNSMVKDFLYSKDFFTFLKKETREVNWYHVRHQSVHSPQASTGRLQRHVTAVHHEILATPLTYARWVFPLLCVVLSISLSYWSLTGNSLLLLLQLPLLPPSICLMLLLLLLLLLLVLVTSVTTCALCCGSLCCWYRASAAPCPCCCCCS